MDVSYEDFSGTGVITLDDGNKNILTIEAIETLLNVLDRAEAEANAVVLRGRPGIFSAGFDRNVMTGTDKEAIGKVLAAASTMLLRLFSFPKPLVTLSEGHTFTIGLLMMQCGDVRVAETGEFKYAMNESALGIPFIPGLLDPMQHQLTSRKFEALINQCVELDPAGAMDYELLDELAEHGSGLDRALELAAAMGKFPSKAFGINKMLSRKHTLNYMKSAFKVA